MRVLDPLEGVWRGTGWSLLPSGERAHFTQTIRVGSIGEGALKLLEGRTYQSEGRLGGTNLEVLSFNVETKTYGLRLYTQGKSADVPITPTASGFTLEYPEGTAKVRFTITVISDTWHEVAERLTPGQPPLRFMELTLPRVGSTDWPAAGAVRP